MMCTFICILTTPSPLSRYIRFPYSKCVNKNDTVLIIRGTEKGNKSYDGGESIAYQTSTKQPIIFQGSSVWESINDLMQIATANKVHVICLEPSNLHGNDLLFDSIALIKLLQSIFSSKAISTSSTTTTTTILVKSKLLAKHAKSFVNVHDFINNGGLSNNDNTKSTNEQIVQVVSAVGVESYRDTIPYVVRPNSRVLEVGCHFGTTTSLIAKATQSPNIVVGIDIGKVCIDRATKKYNGIQFEVIDAWDTASILKLHPSSFDAIYVDVGGMIGADGLFEVLGLVRQLINAYKSSGKLQCIVVKSRCLRDHSVVYKNSDDYLRK